MVGIHKGLLLLACVATLGNAAPAQARDYVRAAKSGSGIVDVTLSADGALTGQFLDGEGRGIDGAVIVLTQGQQPIARTNTDKSGAYRFGGLQNGVYDVTLADQKQTVRVWNGYAAPPAARQLLTTIRNDQIVRGQFGAAALASTVGVAGGVIGTSAGGYAVVQSNQAVEDSEAAMKDAAEARAQASFTVSP